MKQEIEIEFKNMLTFDEFKAVKTYFNLKNEDFVKQRNFYFDTPQFILAKRASALRVREKNQTFELTFKQPESDGLLESTIPITKHEALSFIHQHQFPKSAKSLLEIFSSLHIHPDQWIFLGELTTCRCEFEYKGGLLALDHNFYENQEDFELEYEVKSKQKGFTVFTQLLHELHIKEKPANNKIKRFFEAKNIHSC